MTVSRVLLSCVVGLLTFGCATPTPANTAPGAMPPPTARPTVPAEIEAPATSTPVLKLSATGTQNYKCQAGASGGAEWKLVAPDAQLIGESGTTTGTHGAGPTWTIKDGSGVKGDGANAKKAPSPEAGSVAWLLIPATSNGQPGELQGVTLVQRVDTHGGVAPPTGCDASSVGAETKIPYTATYVFYR